MTDTTRFLRRNRVDERFALAIGAAGGIVAAMAGARPTGSAAVDVGLIIVFAGAVIWASASAPWWAVSAVAGLGAAVALDPIVAFVGFLGFVAGLWIGLRRRDLAVERALVGAVAVNVLIRSEPGGFLGLSAIIGIGLSICLFVLGVRRRPRTVRHPAWIAGAAFLGAAVVAVLGAGVVAVRIRPDLETGTDGARAGVEAMRNGDYTAASEQFAMAAQAFDRVDSQLGGPIAAPVTIIPGFAQNVSAGADLSAAAAAAMAAAARALDQIDPESLAVVNGAIDLDSLRAVEQPLAAVHQALVDIRGASVAADSQWLLGPIRSEIDDLNDELAENETRLADALSAVQLAPQMLGGDGARSYLVMFTTPVEARGITGFPGNYAVIEVDDGRFEVTAFGRRSDLDRAAYENGARCEACPQELLDRYGRFGLDRGDGTVGENAWTSITLPAHFPYVGVSANDLFPQSGGEPIDGVITMDPYVMQALMQYTGPIELEELGVTVDPANAISYLLAEQYELAGEGRNDERIEAIDVLGQRMIDQLLVSSLPAPSQLAHDVGPLIDEQRLLVWSADDDEQALLQHLGMAGALPPLREHGGFSVMVSNAGHSKIDLFLDRDVETTIDTAADGSRTLVADVTLTNDAPASGLPDYVIGNDYGFDTGTSWLWVNFFGPRSLQSAARDGEAVELVGETEAGWTAYPLYETLGPGASVSYRLVFTLDPSVDEAGAPVEWLQPLAVRSL